jgi:DNA-binding IclR family transcriptional regulator
MSAAVNRAFRLVFALQGHAYEGLRLKQIAELVRESSPTTLKDLDALAEAGIVERVPDRADCWRLSPRLVSLAVAHQAELARVTKRVEDFTQRYSRNHS